MRTNKTSILILAVVVLYLFSRLWNIHQFPIFNDESTYIRFGIHQLKEPGHPPYSLRIGKEPLLPFLYALTGELSKSVLVGARIVTVLWGFLTLVGLYLFSKKMFGLQVAILTSLLYTLSPFSLFFDRLALLDSPVSTIAVWSLLLSQMLLERPKWLYAICLGLVMALGLWVKFTSMFYILLPFITLSIFVWKTKKTVLTNNTVYMYLLPFFIATLLYIPLVSHDFYTEHWELLKQYSYPLFSIFTLPVSIWADNTANVLQWLFFYLTPGVFISGVVSLFLFGRRKFIAIVLWFTVPLVYEILFAKLYNARHALLLTVPLFIASSYGLIILAQKRRVLGYALISVIFLWSVYHDATLIMDHQSFSRGFSGKAALDVGGYLRGYASGYGVLEAVNFLENEAKRRPITVTIRNDHGNPEDAVVAYLSYKQGITVLTMNNPSEGIAEILRTYPAPVYFVSRGSYYAGLEDYIVSRKNFYKPNDSEFVGVNLLK